MSRLGSAAALAGACLLAANAAHAHAVAGARVFPVTLTIDDPGVADEASVPTFIWLRSGAQGGPGPVHEHDLAGEFDKRITERLGIGVSDAYGIQDTANDKTRTGWQDLTVSLKYQTYVNAPREFILSLGVIREFGRTGTAQIGADEYGNTTPMAYFGKGLGDLPIGYLRPLAITGTIGYSIADRKLKAIGTPEPQADATDPITGIAARQFNNGYANRWVGGLSVQYSIPYLQQQVKDLHLPDAIGRMVPVVEVAWSSPASKPSDLGTQLVVAPGVLYEGDTYQLGVEALLPANKASGSNVGVIAQFHVFLDDLLPETLGKPIFE